MREERDRPPLAGDEWTRATGARAGPPVDSASGDRALGTAAVAVDSLIGGIAGAVGGWWAHRAADEAARHYTAEDDRYYRSHYDADASRPEDIEYDRARTGYAAGHIAGLNPEYRDREWDDVARDIRSGWSEEVHGPWDRLEARVRHGWEHARHRIADLAASGDPLQPGSTPAGPGSAQRPRSDQPD